MNVNYPASFTEDERTGSPLPAYLDDVAIIEGAVPEELSAAVASGVLWQAKPDELLMEIPDTARLRIRRGEITVDAYHPGVLAKIGAILRRTPLAALLWMRGYLVCRGAAVAGPDGAVLILGASSMGKSTLAAALVSRGARLLADDAAPVVLRDGWAFVLPVWPELVLWPDAVRHLGAEPWLRRRERELFDVPYWDVDADRFCAQPMPLKAVYSLWNEKLHDGSEACGVDGLTRITMGGLMSYQIKIAGVMEDRTALLRFHGATAAKLPYAKALHPHLNLAEVDALADRIIAEAGWSGPSV